MPGSSLLTRLPHTVQWGDCDPAGIIYYPTYYRWMDAATWHLFAQAGYPAGRIRGEQVSLPLVHAECSFVRSPTFGDLCVVESTVAVFGRKSFTVQHRIQREDGTELAHGREIRVWCRYENGPGSPLRGEVMPAEVRALLSGSGQGRPDTD